MRIGIDCRLYGSSGSDTGRYTAWLVRYLAESDTENEYVLFFNEPQFSQYSVPNARFQKIFANAPIFSVAEQTIFLLELYRAKLDRMHFMGYHAPILYFRPFVVTIHDLLPLFYPNKQMAGSFFRQAYRILLHSITRRARHVVVTNRHVARDLSEMVNVPEEKIEIIPPGLCSDDFKNNTSPEEWQKYFRQQGIENPYMLFVGNILEHKNLPRFIRAYAANLINNPKIDLIIAGKEDPNYHEVREVIIELGLQKQVHMMGFVEDSSITILRQGALASFFPSLYEWFEYAAILSLASGTPVLASNIAGLAEVLGDDGALFFRPLSVEGMQEAIQKIIQDRDLRTSLIRIGKERARGFSWEKTGKEMARLYMK